MMTRFVLYTLLLVIPASLQQERCTKPGIKAVGASKFVICSADEDGKLTQKHGECGLGDVFSVEDRTCLPAPKRKSTRNENAATTGVCYNKGYKCTDCKKLDYCLDRGNGLEVVASKECKETEFCSAYTNSCSDKVIPQCQEGYKYTCNYMGLFPDPYKCDTYYFCKDAASEPTEMKCPDGHYYHPLFTECIKYEVNKQAPCPPMEECKADNTLRALKSNPNLYYLCIQTSEKEFMTRVFRCPRDQTFNGSSCVGGKGTGTSGTVTNPLPF